MPYYFRVLFLLIHIFTKCEKGVLIMNYFTISFDKCKQDGLCARECPAGIIRWEGKGTFPALIPGSEKFCLCCGHCVAVCPAGACSWSFCRPEDCPPIQRETLPSFAQMEHLLKARRSTRAFREDTVDRATWQKLLEVAAHSPSGHNLQPVHWIVVEKPEEVQRLAALVVQWMQYMMENQPETAQTLAFPYIVQAWERGLDRVCHGAPHLVIAHTPRKVASSTTDGVIALTYLEMAAQALGLGTCWAGYFTTAANTYPPLREALAIPEDHRVPGTLLLGYPRHLYRRIPKRRGPQVTWR